MVIRGDFIIPGATTAPGIIKTLRNVSRIIRLLFLLVALSGQATAQGTSLTILNYNALHGFSGDSTLMEEYVSWVRDKAPDIVLYEEMNGFTQNDVGLLAERYGHPYAVIMNREFGVPVTHPLAITSRYPILNVKRVMDNMWHGYLYAYIEGIHVFVTHLAPFTLKDRQKDVEKILAQAALIPKSEKIIIAGDFNALSPADSTHYGSKLLASMKRIEGRLEPKSGLPIVRGRTIYRNNLNHGKVDYAVIGRMMEEGYYDSFYLVNKEFKNSVPTRAHQGKRSILRRIDYVWVNDALAKHVVLADVVHDKTTDHLSDHYPVIVKLKLATPDGAQ